MNTTTASERRKSWQLLAALWLLLLVLAASRPLALPDEGRYGEIGRWMLQSGDWLTPRLNGIPFFHKPPYLYWLEALAIQVFGATAWAVRVVPALHAGLMLAGLYLAGRAACGEAVGRRASLMLGTSLSFLIGGQYVNHDMLVACWIGIAIWCFAFAFAAGERPDARLARLGFVACALGVLSKGLIGIVLPGMVLLAWLAWTRRWGAILRLPWMSGLALFALIALPWFIMAHAQFPGMLDYMFGTQQFTRYTATTFNNPRPWWFYLLCLVLLLFPWVFFALRQGWAQWRQKGEPAVSAAAQWSSLAWIWVVVIVGFFSVPASKLVGYVLPVMPPLALLAALGYERLLASGRAWRTAFPALCGLALLIAVAADIAAARYSQRDATADIAQALACGAAPGDTVYVVDDYPYDLPFRVQASRPMVVIQDWPALRQSTGDNWRRELLEGADFDAQAGRVLQGPQALVDAARRPGSWVVSARDQAVEGFIRVAQGRRWALHRSAGRSAPEGPQAAERKGLPGCQDQRHQQRQQ